MTDPTTLLIRLQQAREWWMRTGGLRFAPVSDARIRRGWRPPEDTGEEKAA